MSRAGPRPSSSIATATCSTRRAPGGGAQRANRLPRPLPPALVDATIAAEDRRFFRHPGVDPIALARARVARPSRRANRRRAARRSRSRSPSCCSRGRRTPARPPRVGAKVREAVVALRLEHRLTKREILALYLNLAPYGNQLVGAERASRGYFGCRRRRSRRRRRRSWPALPQRPSGFNPYRSFRRRTARQRQVLQRMGPLGLLDADSRGARRSTSGCARCARRRRSSRRTSWRRVLADLGDGRPAAHRDHARRRRCSATVAGHRPQPAPGARPARRRTTWPSSCSTTRPATGWRGRARATTSIVDARRRHRRRAIAATAGLGAEAVHLRAGVRARLHAGDVLPDVPSHFPTAEAGRPLQPAQLRRALPRAAARARARSPDPRTCRPWRWRREIGVADLLRFLRRAGFTTFDRTAAHYGLGVTLGNAEVRLDELVAAYAAFARGGLAVRPAMIAEQRDGAPAPIRCARRAAVDRVVSDRTAFWITDILSDDDAREFVFGRGGSLEFPFPVAVEDRHVAGAITTTGPSATRATSPSACGSATSTARRCRARRA